MHDGRAVEQLPADGRGHAENEDGGGLGGLAGESLDLAALAVEKSAPLDEILGRVAADDLFGEGRERDVGLGHLARNRNEPGHIARHCPDGGADTRNRDFRQAHRCSFS